MGESACLMPSFSEANQGESISFGRFTSESLSWGKWSTFSHKRYVEEAERYAQPGSVAQKKAFFEAHYKKIAAKKAAEEAALREQEVALNANPDPESECESCITNTYVIMESVDAVTKPEEVVLEKPEDYYVIEKSENDEEELDKEVVPERVEIEKPLLKDFKSTHDETPTPSKKKANSPSSKALAQRKTPKIPIPPPVKYTVSIHEKKENNATPITRKTLLESFNGNKSARKTVPKIPKLVPNNQKENKESVNQNRFTPKLLPKIPVSPAKTASFVNIKRETNSSRKIHESPVVSMKKTTMKSLRTLIYSTPGKEPDESSSREPESSRVPRSSFKASKDYKTPSRTPFMDFTKRESKNNTPAAPWSDNRRRTIQETPASGSKATRPKWHILSAVCSRPVSAQKNKLQSPTLSAPFNLRTEERAARRKQKLEEKFNEKAMPKVQLQTRIKEKAETELRKLRRSLCFRARPLPDFYKEKETSQDQQIKDLKIPEAYPEAQKLRKKPLFTSAKVTLSLSPASDSTKKDDFKNVIQKQKGVINLQTSLPEKNCYENTSPNIEH